MSTTAKVILIVSIALGGLALLVCAAGGALWLYFSSQPRFEEPADIAMFITAPDRVKPGESFTIEVRVVNQADRPQVLDSIDVYDAYTAGIRIRRSDPAWRSSSHMYDFITFDYQIKIPPRSAHVVTFDATALKRGDYEGDFDICVNAPWSCLSEAVRTIVEDEDEGSAPATTRSESKQ
jgi:hypothetical protein